MRAAPDVSSRPWRLSRRSRRQLARTCALWPCSLALLAPLAQAATFVPGTAADPPTGDSAAPSASVADPAGAEPLQAPGFQFRFGPLRHGGSITLDGRVVHLGEGARAVQAMSHLQLDGATYLWQPWFMQVRFGVGVLSALDRYRSDTAPSDSRSNALTGRMALSLFPASRFPFELRADVGNTRSSGETLGADLRTTRVSLSQSYRPPDRNDHVSLHVDHSRLQSELGVDTLSLVSVQGDMQRGAHTLEASAALAWNRSTESDERTRVTTMVGRHSFQPSSSLRVETMASLNDFRQERDVGSGAFRSGQQVRQVTSVVSWRPQPGEPLFSADQPLQIAGSLRWMDASTHQDGGSGGGVQSLSAIAGLNVDLSRTWRAAASVNAAQSRSDAGGSTNSVGANGLVSWTPVGATLGAWDYIPSGSVNAAITQSGGRPLLWIAGVQAGHTLARQWRFGEGGQAISLHLTQSAAVMHDSESDVLAQSLAHGVSAYWQLAGDAGLQRYLSLNLTDTRSRGEQDGSFQFASLQFNQRRVLSRFMSWNVNLSLQASRNESTLFDAFSGARLTQTDGWRTFYSGSASLEQSRLFGVPRLRHTLAATVSSQQIERRQFGDIDATREHISASLESRVDYAIGRLALRALVRGARMDGRTVGLVMLRAQRDF